MSTAVKSRVSKKKTAAAAPVNEVEASAAAVAAQPKKSRSSKKTPPVVAFVGPTGITGSFMNEQRPLIAHIPVSSVSIAFDGANIMKYDPIVPDVPKAYDSKHELSYLDGIPEGSGVCSEQKEADDVETATQEHHASDQEHKVSTPGPGPATKCKLPSYYSEKLMVLFQDANRYQKLPEKTEIACFWCCHGFTGHPCAIPRDRKSVV